jgi:two-component system, OmpR family, response regulator
MPAVDLSYRIARGEGGLYQDVPPLRTAPSAVERLRVLVVEPDPTLSQWVADALRRRGHDPETAASGEEAALRLIEDRFDVAVLDRTLADRDGLEVLREVRAAGDDTPILMVSTQGRVRDRVEGLERGADDYLVKPFALSELVARLGVLARRRVSVRGLPDETVMFGRLTLDLRAGELSEGSRRVLLRPQEAGLLALLMHAHGRAVTRDALLGKLWPGAGPDSKLVDQHVCRLRGRLAKAMVGARVLSIRGVGYRLQVMP